MARREIHVQEGSLERAMGFEPHSVAGSALKPTSRLLQRGPAPSHTPHERGAPLSESPAVGSNHLDCNVDLERAMGFEPTTTCLGSKDSTTELRPLGRDLIQEHRLTVQLQVGARWTAYGESWSRNSYACPGHETKRTGRTEVLRPA